MPLTFSHPAASVPLRRVGLSLSGLVIGSMAPDFAKFAALSPNCGFGHSWLGAFWFAVPTGLIALWIFHFHLKHPLFALLPVAHQRRLAPLLGRFSFLPARRFGVVCLSLLIGAFTHLGWDEFTHKTGVTTVYLPFLSAKLFEIDGYTIQVFKLLQHGGTFVGFGLLVFWYLRWFKTASVHEVDPRFVLSGKAKTQLVFGMIGFASLTGLIFGLFCASQFSHERFLKVFLGRGVVGFGTVLTLALLVYCSTW